MKNHVRLYRNYFNLALDDRVVCEWCGQREAVDVHHIESRGMGGSKNQDYIENLMGLCRECHERAHAELITSGALFAKHIRNL